ncbi:hypothetical protein STEG23_036124 [Scotinomys teguina]
MAERGQRLQSTTSAPRLLQKHRIRGWYQEDLPSKCFTKHKRLKCPGSLDSQRWVFVREELDDSRKGCPPGQRPKDVFLPHIHHRLSHATPKKRQNGLPKGAASLSKLSQAREAFLQDLEDQVALHPLALHHLEESLPAELLLQVLEALDPERKLKDTWGYGQDTRKLMKGPAKLIEKCPSQVCLPKKMPMSHSGQWLFEEKKSKANCVYKGSLLHDNVRRGVQDFCDWATALGCSPIDEELILQQFDMDYQTRHSCGILPAMWLNQDKSFMDGQPSLREYWDAPLSSGRAANPHKPKRVRMRYGAWYLKTKLWKKQRADEPLVDPKISHEAQDTNFQKHLWEQEELLAGLHGTTAFKDFILSRGYRMPRFLEKIYAEEKEQLQESNGRLLSETKGPGDLQGALRLQDAGADPGNAREYVLAGKIPDTHSRANPEVSRNQSPEVHGRERRPCKGQETACSVVEKLPSSVLLRDRAKAASLAQPVSQDPAGHEDWEVVSRHSSWGDVGLGGSLEGLSQGMDDGRGTPVGGRGWEADGKAESLEPQVSIQFQVHYTTSTDVQFIAVTGDHENLGGWTTYIPLHYCKDGLWSHSVFLPADTVVEWKFVLVENREVTRWEECSNRLLQTGREDKVVHGWWGIH